MRPESPIRWFKLVSTLALLPLLVVIGCSDRRTVSQLPGTHPESWMDRASVDFHGQVALQNGTAGCEACHGRDLGGGRTGISCVDCHLSSGACTTCHGGQDNQTGAPPLGLRDETDDSTLAVGAHTVHLTGTVRSAAVACSTCHLVPTYLLEPTHLDTDRQLLDSIAEITWQGFADGGGAQWDRTARTCSNTYCHGNFPGGYANNTPNWTEQGQADCGSCHDVGTNSADLGLLHAIHPSVEEFFCTDCHASVVDSLLNIVTPDLHVNGIVNVATLDSDRCDQCHGTDAAACTHCHGGQDNQTGAPPLGLRGETTAAALAVGSHTTHLTSGYVADAFACDECHVVPTQLTDPGHWEVDSTAEITWGALAGSASQWNRVARTCTETYCHGNFPGGYSANAPIWTAPGQAPCGSCHDDGDNPDDLSGEHFKHVREEDVACAECHAATVDAGLAIIGKGVHVDGQATVDFASRQISYQNGSCSGPDACHETKSWR